MRTLIALLLVCGSVQAQRVPPPGDFTAAYVHGAKAYKACSPPVALRLANAHRSGHLDKLPGAGRFVELVAEKGDPVCVYVLDQLPYLQDPVSFDEFCLDPERYVGSGQRPKKKTVTEEPVFTTLPTASFGPMPGWEPEQKKGLLTREWMGAPGWVWGCVGLFLVCLAMRKRRKEGAA